MHLAHLRAAEEVREAAGLDEIRFVPSAVPPHKDTAGIVPAVHRLRMVELAIAGCPGFRTWSIELERSGPSYSIDTVRALREEVGPEVRIVFILGRDAFEELHTWRDPDGILELCDIVVITRPPWPDHLSIDDLHIASRDAFRYHPGSGSIRNASGRGVSLQRITPLDISATQIRALVAAGRSIRFLVPDAVARYIAAEGLYVQTGAAEEPSA